MGNPVQNLEKYKRPELFFSELIKKYARGDLLERGNAPSVILRATVLAVDVEGGKLENPDASGDLAGYPAIRGPSNPRNSLKARILTDGLDQFRTDGESRIFWPLLPEHISVPVKPGEHVYVLFEDAARTHGLWLCRVSGHEGPNVMVGESMYVSPQQGSLSSAFGFEDPAGETPAIDDTGASLSAVRGKSLSAFFLHEEND